MTGTSGCAAAAAAAQRLKTGPCGGLAACGGSTQAATWHSSCSSVARSRSRLSSTLLLSSTRAVCLRAVSHAKCIVFSTLMAFCSLSECSILVRCNGRHKRRESLQGTLWMCACAHSHDLVAYSALKSRVCDRILIAELVVFLYFQNQAAHWRSV